MTHLIIGKKGENNDSKFSSCQSCGPTNCSVCGVNLDWEHLSDYDKEWVEN